MCKNTPEKSLPFDVVFKIQITYNFGLRKLGLTVFMKIIRSRNNTLKR
jgi:hypothetical protein